MSVKLSHIAPEIREAFRAGNKARKKESTVDTVNNTNANATDRLVNEYIKLFKLRKNLPCSKADSHIIQKLSRFDWYGPWIAELAAARMAEKHPNSMISQTTIMISRLIMMILRIDKPDVDSDIQEFFLSHDRLLSVTYQEDAGEWFAENIPTLILTDDDGNTVKTNALMKWSDIPEIFESGYDIAQNMIVRKHIQSLAYIWFGFVKDDDDRKYYSQFDDLFRKYGYPMNEAFRAGNKARKKESAADAVESVHMDLKSAVYAWCANMKAAVKKRNANTRIPYKTDDFYLPEAVWSDLETDGRFESEENIHLTGRGKNARLKGSVSIEVARINDDTVELGFWYERADGRKSEWLFFDDNEHDESVPWIKISVSDLGSEKGVRVMTDALDRCWNMMFPAGR